MKAAAPKVSSHVLVENGPFPNNGRLPLLIYKQAFEKESVTPENFEQLFTSNFWPAAWRNGIYSLHHYHSTAHEVLGVYRGWVEACFGGPDGLVLQAEAGDVIIIPAGVSHCNKKQSSDFRVVGAYPQDQVWDMKYGKDGERPTVDQVISTVTLPTADPVLGMDGLLKTLWA
jgi:uncharacterized protein YjlB